MEPKGNSGAEYNPAQREYTPSIEQSPEIPLTISGAV